MDTVTAEAQAMPIEHRLRTTEVGQERFCPSCAEWWPADKEFFWATKGVLSKTCKACSKEKAAKAPSVIARKAAKRVEVAGGVESSSGLLTRLLFRICAADPAGGDVPSKGETHEGVGRARPVDSRQSAPERRPTGQCTTAPGAVGPAVRELCPAAS